MEKFLLSISIGGIFISLTILLYIFLKKKTASFHGIWVQAISGDNLAKTYCYISISSFVCAVISVFLLKF